MNVWNKRSLILFSPGVHTGGGSVLIKNIITNLKNSIFFLDTRLQLDNNYHRTNKKVYISQTIIGRLIAEYKLLKTFKKNKNKIIFCFHGIPPFFLRKNKNIVIFLQNSLHYEKLNYSEYPFKVLIRLFFEKFILKLLMYKVGTFIVQTPNMKRLVIAKLFKFQKEKISKIKILPFLQIKKKKLSYQNKKIWDFIYVADGLAHKNHKQLIDAWVELANRNVYPELALTIDIKYNSIINYLEKKIINYNLKIKNLGKISQKNVHAQYQKASALIYPSYTESFGLPLLEAKIFNLPILASELDYVRDVCDPIQTFDPKSFISIARAVERFLNLKSKKLKVYTNKTFIDKVFEK
jgi:glycosyltransferase involved in cell wall biosynthesis